MRFIASSIEQPWCPKLTTNGTKEHEERPLAFNPLCNFVAFVVSCIWDPTEPPMCCGTDSLALINSPLLHLLNGGFHLCSYGIGKRRIGQFGSHFLPIINHPIEEISQDFPFIRIFGFFGTQQPCNARDGISVVARSAGDGNAESRRHALGRRGGCGDALQ